jgi:hypothetical protein
MRNDISCLAGVNRLNNVGSFLHDRSTEHGDRKKLLNQLLQSLKEAKAISQGKLKPSRRFVIARSVRRVKK